jgi:antitoxin MazE
LNPRSDGIHVAGAREFAVARRLGREDLLKRLRAVRGRLPEDFKFDRDEADVR